MRTTREPYSATKLIQLITCCKIVLQDYYTLTCVQGATLECKSILLSLAFISRWVNQRISFYSYFLNDCNVYFYCFTRFIDLEKVIAASRIEEEFQVEIWGVVEGGHDMDRLNNAVRLSSVGTFMSMYLDHEQIQQQWSKWKA